jgi:hypothetical protein
MGLDPVAWTQRLAARQWRFENGFVWDVEMNGLVRDLGNLHLAVFYCAEHDAYHFIASGPNFEVTTNAPYPHTSAALADLFLNLSQALTEEEFDSLLDQQCTGD